MIQTIDAKGMNNAQINQRLQRSEGAKAGANVDYQIQGCLGQRFIGAGLDGANVRILGVPGNALGAYLNGAVIEVVGNAQDAVGDTMNDGRIIIHGNVGDTAGYAMRGGEIYVQGDAGYRAGVHMKEYGEKRPIMVIGGCAGSFLGEYQAGGLIIVLGLTADDKNPLCSDEVAGQERSKTGARPIVSNFPCTGMHGGKLVLRGDASDIAFPPQVSVHEATAEDMDEIEPYVSNYGAFFSVDPQMLMDGPYTVITPLSSNPYTRLYASD